ncbi:hypothetical protein RRG08_043780, partial [Elysia crispata]
PEFPVKGVFCVQSGVSRPEVGELGAGRPLGARRGGTLESPGV